MKIAIMQPTFFPWLGYFELISKSDRFVFLDSVELSKQSWQTRNLFRTSNGYGWQSLPIKGSSQSKITNAKINNPERFIKKLHRTIQQTSSKSPHKLIVSDFFEAINEQIFLTVADFNIWTIIYFSELLGLNTEFFKSSDMKLSSDKDSLVIEILKQFECNTYISTPGSEAYMSNFGLDNYPFNIEFMDYSKSIITSEYFSDYGYENILDILTRVGLNEVIDSVF